MKPTHASLIVLCMSWTISMSLYAQEKSNPSSTKQKKEMETNQNIKKNKAVIRRLYEECLNTKNVDILPDLVAENYLGLLPDRKGVAAFQPSVEALIKAFPDSQWTVEDLVAEGNAVAIHWHWKGTQTERYQDIAATHKTITNDGMAIYELHAGKITGTKILTDRLGFFQPLERVSADINTLQNKSINHDYIRFIDRFVIPQSARHEFMTRVAINRDLIKTKPGFIEDEAYESMDENGNTLFITIAVWESSAALKNAKEAVQTDYKKEGFDPEKLMERLHITMDRGLYKAVELH